MHGDTLCTDDVEYQAWRRKARDPAFQADFLAKPLGERRKAVAQMRERSRQVVQEKTAEIMDVSDDAVRQALRTHGVRRLIHGHTHRPGRHVVDVDGERCERWVLPDWYGRGGYIQLDRGNPRLVQF
jgi:UDP-2,3-diacylglucosamine hydrolase